MAEVSAPLGGPAPMTVRAHDLALCNLRLERLGAAAAACEKADCRALRADVIELEHEEVTLVTIRAARPLEHLVDEPEVPHLLWR
jgi:hypothetical protein